MKVAIQINNYNQIGKTTTYLIEEGLDRNYNIFIYPVDSLSLEGSKVITSAKLIESFDDKPILSEAIDINLNDMDLVLIRNDPPVDLRYITATYILERCKSIILNNPKSIRDFPEKFINYDKYTFNTLISGDISRIKNFCEEYNKPFVIKPLYSYGGNDITRFEQFTKEAEAQIQFLINKYQAPILIQEFCEKVLHEGDKRIVLLNGKILGCFKRKNDKNFIVNMLQGGEFSSCKLTSAEEEICLQIAKDLQEKEIILAGVDMIDGRITEINVTSISGVFELNKLYHINTASICWNAFEEKVWN
jgi:glutathione synthase